MTTTAAAAGTRRHTGTFPAEPGQIRHARAALAGWLGGWPLADEAVLVCSEFATNSVVHSASRDGGAFTLRVEVRPDRLRIEVEDGGGPWNGGPRDCPAPATLYPRIRPAHTTSSPAPLNTRLLTSDSSVPIHCVEAIRAGLGAPRAAAGVHR